MSTTIIKPAEIVPASAGSGKTYRIAHEYVYDVLRDRLQDDGKERFDPTFYKRILAVTFTNKATEEMKSRILEEIHLLASGKKSDHLADLIKETGLSEQTLRERAKEIRSRILHDYSHFTILTNDTFFQRILRAFVHELGIDMNFTTELDTAPIFDQSVNALLEKAATDEELQDWLISLLNDVIENKDDANTKVKDKSRPNWNIRTALASLEKELFKEANKEIISRIDKQKLHENVEAFKKLVDNTSDPTKELGKRGVELLEKYDASSEFFQSKIRNFFTEIANGKKEITDANKKQCSNSATEWFYKGKVNKAQHLIPIVEKVLQPLWCEICDKFAEVEALNNTLKTLLLQYRSFSLLGDLSDNIEEVCSKENSMLLSETKHTISTFIGDTDAPFIYEKVGGYFEKFMIDEFQDTSAKEWKNFLPLLLNSMSQAKEKDRSVLIVGDVKQSIYRWRGGDWRILGQQIDKDLKECNREPLKYNWRSLRNIVEFNNQLYTPQDKENVDSNKKSIVANENERLNKILVDARKNGLITIETYKELYDTLNNAYSDFHQDAKRETKNQGYVYIAAGKADIQKGEILQGESGMPLYIERIREVLKMEFKPCDITIVVRTNKQAMEIAEEMLRYRSQFPVDFEITTEEALKIAISPAVKFIIAAMRLAINRNDKSSLALYNQTLGNKFGADISEEETKFLDTISVMSPEDAFEHITIRYADIMKGQTAYVIALHDNILRFSTGKVADIATFDTWWKEKCDTLSVRVERSDRAIQILTIHKSKGLENKVIFIPQCDWSVKPKPGSIVWAKPADGASLTAIEAFPVPYNKNSKTTFFAEDCIREEIYSSVDGMNMLYVATTRAKEQLHIFIPNKGLKEGLLNKMVTDIFGSLMKNAEKGNYRYYELGEFDGPEPPKESKEKKDEKVIEREIIEEYNASPVSVKLRTSVSKYFENEEAELTPRSTGILLHRAFENAITREDIYTALEDMVKDGTLKSKDVAELKQKITSMLDNTVAGEWFDGSWSNLYRERNIIRPKESSKRPDRVLTRGNEAVIVDYKFGKETDDHHNKMKEYIENVRSMGFTSVKGYLWYVPREKIVHIEK